MSSPNVAVPPSSASDEAVRLAATLERGLAEGRSDLLTPDALQSLLGALCKTYCAQTEAGDGHLPLDPRTNVTPTDIMVTASGLIKAGGFSVFELGMWQSCTGR